MLAPLLAAPPRPSPQTAPLEFLSTGAWHHLCVVHDRDGFASFYTDGLLNGTRPIAGQGNITSGLPTAIGQDGTLTYNLDLIASLDNVRIWRRALGQYEVERLVSGLDTAVGNRYCVGSPNTEFNGGRILALGSSLIQENDLRLIGVQVPANQLGLFFFGTSQALVPTAGGFRCAGGSIFRIHPGTIAGQGGTIEQRLNLTQYPFIGTLESGTTHNFQLWYRDPTSSIATSNFTDGLAIPFF